MCPPPTRAAADPHLSRVALADIVRAHGARDRLTHRLARVPRAALRAIETWRTAVLGGHVATCDRCGAVRVSYNSCRNRHCPKCQTLAKERWLVAARRTELLPIPYFHVVFTLPHALNAFAQGNPRVMYTLLFRAAADTLLTFGRDPRHLGGTIGITAILHTWGQTLTHRVALSNDRLIGLDTGVVRFRWKDYADQSRVKVMALDVDEFLRRFLRHVLPRGFMRIRHFGLLANRTRRRTLTRCRALLGHRPRTRLRNPSPC